MDFAESPFDVLSEPEVLLAEVKAEPNEAEEQVYFAVEYLEESDKSSVKSLQEVSNEVVNVKCESSSEEECRTSSRDKKKIPTPSWKRKVQDEEDPEYIPNIQVKGDRSRVAETIRTSYHIHKDRTTLKHYKRTIIKHGCIFKDCARKDTEIIPDLVRIKLLRELKLYVLKSSEACSIHKRDQNWEDLLLCTYEDFRATDVEDIITLLKQTSLAKLDFEQIELIPTRLLRFWMNVNKVQFTRIYESYPYLQTLKLPKTSLSVYLMSLQNTDVERIALLLQFSEETVLGMVKSVRDIVHFETYDELNDVFRLEY